MTAEWAATLFANLFLTALLIATRPPRVRTLWAFVIASVACDWFFMANRNLLIDEMYNVPWELSDLLCIALESAACFELLKNYRDSNLAFISAYAIAIHLMLRYREYRVWFSVTGPFRFHLELNQEGWQAFHMRQAFKLVLTAVLAAFILQERNSREGELNA